MSGAAQLATRHPMRERDRQEMASMAPCDLVRSPRAGSRGASQMAELDRDRRPGGASYRGAAEYVLRRAQGTLDFRTKRASGARKRQASHCLRRPRLEPPSRPTLESGEGRWRGQESRGETVSVVLCSTGPGCLPAGKREIGGIRERLRAGPGFLVAGIKHWPCGRSV